MKCRKVNQWRWNIDGLPLSSGWTSTFLYRLWGTSLKKVKESRNVKKKKKFKKRWKRLSLFFFVCLFLIKKALLSPGDRRFDGKTEKFVSFCFYFLMKCCPSSVLISWCFLRGRVWRWPTFGSSFNFH